MTARFSVYATSRYERLIRKLLRRHPELRALHDRAREILGADPYNRSSAVPIKKLEGVPPGEGQWRLSLGRFRFRYDVFGREVWLFYCALRREDTYDA
jgi:hypothetical protein